MRTLPPKLELMAPLTDAELVERIIGGDSGVFELLMRRHNQRLFRLARSVVRNSDEAEEIVQETYLRAYANLARFEGRSSVVTWLSRIAFHQALRPQRRKRQSRVTDGLDLDALQMSDTSPSENDSIARDELRTSLAAAMDSPSDELAGDCHAPPGRGAQYTGNGPITAAFRIECKSWATSRSSAVIRDN